MKTQRDKKQRQWQEFLAGLLFIQKHVREERLLPDK